jgi:hypothetical protein
VSARTLPARSYIEQLTSDDGTREERRLEAVRAGHWQGAKYQRGRDLRDIAADVRRDIAAAIKVDALPRGLKVAVRISRYSMGQSMTVTVKEAPFAIANELRVAWDMANPYASHANAPADVMWLRSETARAVLEDLTAIANAYNYDRSDSCTDYYDSCFHLSVEYDWEIAQADREAVRASLGAKAAP